MLQRLRDTPCSFSRTALAKIVTTTIYNGGGSFTKDSGSGNRRTVQDWQYYRHLSSTSGLRIGTDLLEDSLRFGTKRKLFFDGYSSSGFDINGMDATEGETVHINGSCIAFPHMLYLWQPKSIQDVTKESLGLLTIRRPAVDILLIGAQKRMEHSKFQDLLQHFSQQGTVVEQMDLLHACATFNVLNGEDRNVAVALVSDDQDDDDEEEEKNKQ